MSDKKVWLTIENDKPQVWVMELEYADGGGYISIHRTETSAFRKLVNHCRWLGITVQYDTYLDMVRIGELDDEPAIASYSISKLPVEE